MSDFKANEIVKEFSTPSEPLRILDGVSVELDRGENLAVIGPSGSGKSTFLHIAGTLDRPTTGTASLLGQDLNQIPDKQLAAFRNQNIGFVFQEHYLLPQLSALENILVPIVAQGKTDKDSVDRANELLNRVGLAERAQHLPAQLSGGEKQRVAVARALIRNPVLVLADEPTGNLDSVNADRIGEILLDVPVQENAILICVTHSDRLAKQFQKQVRLEDGKFVKSEGLIRRGG